MIKKIVIIISIYFLTIFQYSFLVHFFFLPHFLSFNTIITIIYNLYEDKRNNFGIIVAFFSGLFLDIFSQSFFGLNIIIMVLISVSIKYIIKNYVGITRFQKI